MKNNFSFAILMVLLLGGLGWWGRMVEGPGAWARASSSEQGRSVESKRKVLEVLDQLVTYELYYRSVYGRFTKIVSRLGLSIPHDVSKSFEINVAEVSDDRLVVTAFSEINGRTMDEISIDQDYQVHSNFKIPLPRPDYLRAQAIRHLRFLRNADSKKGGSERGIFKDYFKYDVRNDSEGHRVAFAVGIRPPVVGLQMEYGASQVVEEMAKAEDDPVPPLALDLNDLVAHEGNSLMYPGSRTGQISAEDVMSPYEEAHLAQTIFHGEMGREARNLTELSRISHFEFKKRVDKKNQEAARQLSGFVGGLVIEPIQTEEHSSKSQSIAPTADLK